MAHVVHEQTTAPSSSQMTQPMSLRQGDHEQLFRLLEEVGPAPDEFMLHVSDPVIERENIFENEDE